MTYDIFLRIVLFIECDVHMISKCFQIEDDLPKDFSVSDSRDFGKV